MARPKKTGLDYFPLDVHFYGNIKVRKLMRGNGGGKAAFVYVILLCKIYESGYYMLWDDEMSFILSEITGFDEGMLRETIKSCLRLDLLDKELYERYQILTSRSIQSRYFAAVRRRVGTADRLPYVYPELLKEFFSADTENLHTGTDNKKGFPSSGTQLLHTETPFLSAERTLNEIKDKSSLCSDLVLPPSPSPTTRARESDNKKLMSAEKQFLHAEIPLMPSSPIDVKEAVRWLKNQRDWLLQMQQLHGIDAIAVTRLLDDFVNECRCRGKQLHENLTDVMEHFNDWLRIKTSTKSQTGRKAAGREKTFATDDYSKRWTKCLAELCQSVSAEEAYLTYSQMRYERYDPDAGTLLVQIPSKDVYDRLESSCVPALDATIKKYFGKCKLQYRIVQ